MVLVAGATGFLGSHVVEALLAHGERVKLFVRRPQRAQWLEKKGAQRAAGDLSSAVGSAFHSIDDGNQTWRDYFVALCRALNLSMPRWSVPRAAAYSVATLMAIYGRAMHYSSRPLVTRTAVEILGTRQGFSMARARERLGFPPVVGFEEGVRSNGSVASRRTTRSGNRCDPLLVTLRDYIDRMLRKTDAQKKPSSPHRCARYETAFNIYYWRTTT